MSKNSALKRLATFKNWLATVKPVKTTKKKKNNKKKWQS